MAGRLDACPCAGTTLDRLLQPAILAILAEGPQHGYLLLERLGRLRLARGREPDPTGVYRTLKAIERRGLVNSAWNTPEAGPASRRFALTAAGRRCIARWVATLEEYAGGIGQLAIALRRASRPGSGVTKGRRPRRAAARRCCP
jgi:DNA-binding PadR family transcriptional regulator